MLDSVGDVAGHAQVTQGRKVMVAPGASVENVSFMQNVDFAPFILWAVKGEPPALGLRVELDVRVVLQHEDL
jgi:hypothetical protein